MEGHGTSVGRIGLVKAVKGEGRTTRGQELFKHLHGRGDFKMTTDEVLALMRGPPADES